MIAGNAGPGESGRNEASPETGGAVLPAAGELLVRLALTLNLQSGDAVLAVAAPDVEALSAAQWRELVGSADLVRVAAGRAGASSAGLALAAAFFETIAPGFARPSLDYLVGVAAEWRGDLVTAERKWEQAAANGDIFEAAASLMQLNFTRGDYARASSLYRRAHDSEAPFAEFAESGGPELGRNERCWCGSERKYKVCHLGKPRVVGLARRSAMLLDKVLDINRDPRVAMVFEALFANVQSEHPHRSGALRYSREFVREFGVFEFGGIAAFRAGLGQLLPADEAALVDEWESKDRSVYRIEGGETVTLTDVRSGERFDVRGWGEPAIIGGRITAILLPDGGSRFRPVAVRSILSTEVDEFLAFLGTRPRPKAVDDADWRAEKWIEYPYGADASGPGWALELARWLQRLLELVG